MVIAYRVPPITAAERDSERRRQALALRARVDAATPNVVALPAKPRVDVRRDWLSFAFSDVDTIARARLPTEWWKSVKAINGVIAERYALPMRTLLESRKRDIVMARHELWWAVRSLRKFSFPRLGEIYRRDHTSILYGVQKMEALGWPLADEVDEGEAVVITRHGIDWWRQHTGGHDGIGQ